MKLIAPWSKATCPFCFKRFHLSKAPKRSLDPREATEPDSNVGTFLSMPPPAMGKVTDPEMVGVWRGLLRRMVLNDNYRNDHCAICPNCHMSLPAKTAQGELSSKVFAIIGARNSGKSNYFGVLLTALERRYASEVGFSMFDQDTFSIRDIKPISSRKLYRERYGKHLFDPQTPKAIEQTQSAKANLDVRIPLIYRLQFAKRPWQYVANPLARVNPMDLVIYDAAGEDMDDETTLGQFYRFILCSAGIIFLIDPFQYSGIRSQLPSALQKRLPVIETEPSEVVSRVISLFERRGGLRAGAKIAIPVAFVLSKCDMLKGLVYPGSQILQDSAHQGGFDLEGCRHLSEEVIECIRKWDSPQLINLGENHFRSFCFFAVSALGSLPDEKTLQINSLSPLRVADPLLWLLWKSGYLPAMQTAKNTL